MSMARFKLNDALEILSKTPKVLRMLLGGLPDEWIHANEGENTWSPYEVLGHLIHGEKTDWLIRVQTIIDHGDSKTFEAFDRKAHLQNKKEKSLPMLLDEFAAIRSKNVQQLQTLIIENEDLNRIGKHPDFGIVTMRELLSTWTVHDFNHIAQIVRVMGKYYADEVGPWKAYLGILQPK
ncbi:DinB family protein [Shimazuella alba]|nr:DinB family protein [Shimazuella alba]